MNKTIQKFSTKYGDKDLTVELGHLAGQADGSVFIRYGDTSALVTAVMNEGAKDVNYMPLTVEYQERYYAAGKIKGSRWVKRETRPSDEAILTSRMIDRALRPRFDQRIRNEIQVVVTVLSFDDENDPDMVGLIGASTALMISDIPFSGPIGMARVAEVDGKFIINPNYEQREKSKFDLVVAGTEDKVNMLELKADRVDEKKILDAIDFGHRELKKIIAFQKEIFDKVKPTKREPDIFEPDSELLRELKEFLGDKLEKCLYESKNKTEMKEKMGSLNSAMKEHIKKIKKDDPNLSKILQETDNIFGSELDRIVHKNILEKEKRSDGRKLDQIRPLTIEVGVLPRTHGSAIFTRGETQALTILTLAGPSLEQWIEGMEIEAKKRFMHHYNFPPYSTGETGRVGFTGRREIGHGALAEKSLKSVIPSKEDFPYTIRLVSEILSSNGSTSMASVCASSLALMDGGVPIKEPVAGISMGLVMSPDGNRFKVLTDIQGEEDHHGDMDLKVAGTRNGITGIQMDVKIEGVTREILEKAFEQAKKARFEILDAMEKVIAKPRPKLSPYAPRVLKIKVNPDKIRNVIGPQGKVINEIIAQTDSSIDIEDDGVIFVTADNEDSAKRAISWIKNLTKELHPGDIFEGRVTRIVDFGAFVEIFPGQEGLVHISEISKEHVNKVSDVLKVGDKVQVKIKNIDELGRINLTMK